MKSSEKDFTRDYFDINFYRLLKGLSCKETGYFGQHCRDSLNFTGQYYVCIVALIRTLPGDQDHGEEWYNPEAVAEEIERCLARRFPFYRLIPCKDIVIHIVNLREQNGKITLVRELARLSDQLPLVSLTLGVGRIREDLCNLWKSFSDGMTALKERAPEKKTQVIDSDWMLITYNIRYTFEQQNMIVSYLGGHDMENLSRLLREIIAVNTTHNLSYKHMNILFSHLFDTAVRYAGEIGFDIKKIASEQEQLLFNTDNIPICRQEDKLTALVALYDRVMRITRHYGKDSPDSTVERVIKYAEDNYHRGLYLESISSHMSLSRSYLARVFKEKTGESLVDYISLVQIRKSKSLLLSTRKSIEEIGQMVGIPNRVTFYRQFKKYEGVSPSSFRRSLVV